MKKDKFNSVLRAYAMTLSPQPDERKLIGEIYQSFNALFGVKNCIQIGSYPRFTAHTPVKDLDLLYFLGNWDNNQHCPEKALAELKSKIEGEYLNPTAYRIGISLQSHSITVSFRNGVAEIISVDIVPAYVLSKNEFGDDTYMVPEVLRKNHGKVRSEFYKQLSATHSDMAWIPSDPRGYIEMARRVNDSNNDFRKTVKLVKAWKSSCKKKDVNFKLKSFHIEQGITAYFRGNGELQIFDAIFRYFVELPKIITQAKIPDRADDNKYIDDYINKLTLQEKESIIKARDGFLIKLEDFTDTSSVADLIDSDFHTRVSEDEEYLFDSKIPILEETGFFFSIFGEVQEGKGGFRKYILDRFGFIPVDRKIKFDISGARPHVSLFKWKVKNDPRSKEPRGEITDHHTKNQIENTAYNGQHYVECYALLNGVCVAKAKQKVVLNPGYYDG